MYKTYVRPILEYAGPVWFPVLVRDKNLLENVQRRATRIGLGVNRPSYPERLLSANLPTFEKRRFRGDLIMTFRILKYNYANLSDMFQLNRDARLRGHLLKLKKERFSTRQREHFLTNRVLCTWNNLPSDVVDSESINSFKNKVDDLLFV